MRQAVKAGSRKDRREKAAQRAAKTKLLSALCEYLCLCTLREPVFTEEVCLFFTIAFYRTSVMLPLWLMVVLSSNIIQAS